MFRPITTNRRLATIARQITSEAIPVKPLNLPKQTKVGQPFNAAAFNSVIFGSNVETPLVVSVHFYNRIMSPKEIEIELDTAVKLRPRISSLVFNQVGSLDIPGFFRKIFSVLEEHNIPCLEINSDFFGYRPHTTMYAIEKALTDINPKKIELIRILNNHWSNNQVERIVYAFLKTNISVDLSGNSAQELWLDQFEKLANEERIKVWKESGASLANPIPQFILKSAVKPQQYHDIGC